MDFNRREKALLEREYSIKDIERLCNFSKEELEYATRIGFSRISKDTSLVEKPVAIFVGGQPGSGKSSETKRVRDEIQNIVEINIDMYRSYHPKYFEIEEAIKKHWYDEHDRLKREMTDEDTPGNDIADFTHRFVSDISDALIEMASMEQDGKYYNMVIEWGMNNPDTPLNTMKTLKNKGYTNMVRYVCVHKDISLEACSIRASAIDDGNHIVRKPPKSFHQYYIDTLPEAANKMYQRGIKNGIISDMKLVLRDGTVVWDSKIDYQILPGDIYREYLNDKNLTLGFANSREMARVNSLNELHYLRSELTSLTRANDKTKNR